MRARELYEKNRSSESISHERTSEAAEHKPMQGYIPHPADKSITEVFGISNSFDNISVGADKNGRFTISVSSQKEYHLPTLQSDRKLLRGTRRRIRYGHFGELHTNLSSRGNSAFAFRSNKLLSENRIMNEFKIAAAHRLSRRQRNTAPFLTLDEDKKKLQRLRGEHDPSPEMKLLTGKLEQTVLREAEFENRFLRRLRVARIQLKMVSAPDGRDLISRIISRLNDAENEGDDDKENNNDDNNDLRKDKAFLK